MNYDQRHKQLHDTVMIVDAYKIREEAERSNIQLDNIGAANEFGKMVRILGRNTRQMAIVSQGDAEAETAYRKAGFATISVNGNRPEEVAKFIRWETHSLNAGQPPNHLVIVTNDPMFDLLASAAVQKDTQVSFWIPGLPPPELVNPEYEYRRLEDLLDSSMTKVVRLAIYIDYENIHIGLEQMGIDPDPARIIEAVRALCAGWGKIVEIDAYADWSELARGYGRDIQRELAALSVRTHYQINRHGKNSADMALANDIRTRIERRSQDADAVDAIVLASRDRDFSTIVKEAMKTKDVYVLGLSQDTSKDLKDLTEVHYLDEKMSPQRQPVKVKSASDEQFALLLGVATYLTKHHFKWAYVDKLAEAVGVDGSTRLRRAVTEGLLKPESPKSDRRLMLNPEHPDAYLAGWLINRIDYAINRRKMPYIDTNFLHRGMSEDAQLQKFGIGQERKQVWQVLTKAERSGYVFRKSVPHHNVPDKVVDAWWLAEHANRDTSAPQETTDNSTTSATGDVHSNESPASPNPGSTTGPSMAF